MGMVGDAQAVPSTVCVSRKCESSDQLHLFSTLQLDARSDTLPTRKNVDATGLHEQPQCAMKQIRRNQRDAQQRFVLLWQVTKSTL